MPSGGGNIPGWLKITGLAVGAVGLTIVNVLQAGADPATDGLEVADIAALADASTAAEDAGALSQATRVGSALKSDAFHRSVSWVVDNPAAQRFTITGGDGVQRALYQLPGELNGKPGVFEWIVDDSSGNPVITHQRFITGGGVTGYPNQVP